MLQKELKLDPARNSYLIGREPACDICLASPQVSRRHASISFPQPGKLQVTDLNSKFGTIVNGQKATQAPLCPGDKIQLAIFELVITYHDEAFWIGHPERRADSNFVAEFPLTGKASVMIGRSSTAGIILDLKQVSRFHSKIELEEDGFAILDLGSTNGTFLNGEPVTKAILQNRDIIQIGPVRLLYYKDIVFQLNQKDVVRLDLFNASFKIRQDNLIKDISLSVLPREFVGILGPSGAGKSTLMKLMAGILQPSEGSVLLNGSDLNQHYKILKNAIGYVPQEDIIHPELSVRNTLRYAAELRLPPDMSPKEKTRRINRVIEILELQEREHSPVERLSGGQKKRVNMGVELLTEPSVLFLDEPTSGLDPGLELKMMQIFRRLADSGQTVVLTTHVMEQINLFHQVAIVYQGYLVYYGPPADLMVHFQIQEANTLFTRLEEKTPAEWVEGYRHSAVCQKYVADRLNAVAPAPEEEKPENATVSFGHSFRQLSHYIFFKKTVSTISQLRILVDRYLHIILRDRLNVILLLAQAPFIGLLLILVFRNYRNEWPLLFCMSLTAIWFGCINSIKEITKEKHIYFRERTVNLRIFPYVFSKVAVLAGLCLIQVVLMLVLVKYFAQVKGSFWHMGWVLLLSSLGGLTMGLLISAAVSTTDKALSILPMVLLPQILFSGIIVNIDDMITVSQYISGIMLSRWSYSLLKNINLWQTAALFSETLILAAFIPLFFIATLGFQKSKDKRI
jgi:ABC-type multidrug transport system ATPase subunit/pSer/pThr/pTyr-binding forkhead associated (FHA) protein